MRALVQIELTIPNHFGGEESAFLLATADSSRLKPLGKPESVDQQDTKWLIETKGMETEDVSH
jgi:hypothetical protein